MLVSLSAWIQNYPSCIFRYICFFLFLILQRKYKYAPCRTARAIWCEVWMRLKPNSYLWRNQNRSLNQIQMDCSLWSVTRSVSTVTTTSVPASTPLLCTGTPHDHQRCIIVVLKNANTSQAWQHTQFSRHYHAEPGSADSPIKSLWLTSTVMVSKTMPKNLFLP